MTTNQRENQMTAIEVVSKYPSVPEEDKHDMFETFLHYMLEYTTEFYDYGKFRGIEDLLEFTGTLHKVLDEAEMLGISHYNALLSPMVGRKLSLMPVEQLVLDNCLLLPLSYFIGDVIRSGLLVHPENKDKVYIALGGKSYDVEFDESGRNYSAMVNRMGGARNVIVPVMFARGCDGSVDYDTLVAKNALEYYPATPCSITLDLSEFLSNYFNQWAVSPMPFSGRDEIVGVDRYVANVIAESFSSVLLPADMLTDAFKLMGLTGDDVRHSRSFRTAMFVDALISASAKLMKPVMILK